MNNLKYIIEFNNGYSTRVIGEADSYQEARQVVVKFLEEKNYKSHYWRSWATEDGKKIQLDVGSWSEFFYISRNDGAAVMGDLWNAIHGE